MSSQEPGTGREFIIRARRAPVEPGRFLASIGVEPHVEYLAQIVLAGLFLAQGHRDDTVLNLVLENSPDFSRTLRLDGASLGSMAGLDERALLKTMAHALEQGQTLGKEESTVADNGIGIRTISFEHLVKEKASQSRVFVLDKKGTDIRDLEPGPHPVFLLTDHIPMPKKTFRSLARLGVEAVSVGPVMLHASQCLVLIHNELDRRG